MRAGLAGCLAVVVAISGACGGRLVREGDDGFGADSGTGGSSSSGAGTNRGATSSTGARPSAGGVVGIGGKGIGIGASPAGGAFGTSGSTGAGGGCVCPIVDCAPDHRLVPNADGCCYHCESLCNDIACPAIGCGPGSHLEQPPGLCCPICVQDSCLTQRTNYQIFRQQLIDKYSSLVCMTDADCSIYYEKNNCAVGCGIAVPGAAIRYLESGLQSYAQQNCTPNCMNPIAPCEPTAPSTCFKGWCG